MSFVLCVIIVVLQVRAASVSIYEESSFFHDLVHERMIVLIISRLGLANRLRAVADWYQIATISDRTLLVSWEATPDCNAEFTDLFVDGPPRFRILQEHLPRGVEGVRHVENLANKRNISNWAVYHESDDQFFVDKYKSFVIAKNIPFSDKEVIITHYDGAVSLEGVHCQQYMMMHSQFLSNLVPNDEAQNFLKTMKNEHFVNRIMVGIHFRAHDYVQDWAVVPPLMGATEAKTFGAGSTVEDFLSVMGQIQNKFAYTDSKGHMKSMVRFFIASNNDTEKAKFRQAVPDGIFLAGDHNRNSPGGMQLALLEWLAPSQSEIIVNTYGSSFAEQAAHVHRRPLVGIWDGMLVHHLSIMLPYCGHLQFIKAHSQQGQQSRYTEGTADNREVSSCSGS